MKFIAQLFLVAGLAFAAISAGAAPRAAEDPSDVVTSTSEPAPRVQQQSAKSAQSAPTAKSGKKSPSTATSKSSNSGKSTKKAGKA